MQADAVFVGQFLAFVALMAGTIEYCEVLQRRSLARSYAVLRAEAADSALGGLIRVFAADPDADAPRKPPVLQALRLPGQLRHDPTRRRRRGGSAWDARSTP